MIKKILFSLVLAVAVLPVLVILGCTQPIGDNPTEEEETLSCRSLLDNLDAIKEGEMRSGRTISVFRKNGNRPYEVAELGAYIDAVRSLLGSYVSGQGENRLHPVLPRVITYFSTDAAGTVRELSGLVFIPLGLKGKISVPIIAYQHGTQLYRSCEPSSFRANPRSIYGNPELAGAILNYIECSIGALMAAKGYIVIMCDYPGFGTDEGLHPYLHVSLGDAVRDGIAHTIDSIEHKELSPRVNWNGKLFLMGYSEGGYATMAAARSIQSMNLAQPDSFRVTAAFPMAGSYDLSTTERLAFISETPFPEPYYFPYALSSYDAIYSPASHEFRGLMAEGYDSEAFTALFDGTHTLAEIAGALPASGIPADLLTDEAKALLAQPWNATPVGRILAANDTWRGWIPFFPMQMIHCPADDIVPFANAEAAYLGFGPLPQVPPPIPVVPIDIPGITGDVHLRAYLPAMLTGFTLIDTLY